MKLLMLLVLSLGELARAQSGELTLEAATREALDKNLDLAAAKFNISIAEAREITAGLRPNPVLTVNGNHIDPSGRQYNGINNAGPYELSLRTDFLLERGGKREARMAFAATEKTLAELEFRDALRRLIFDVESAFVDVQLAQEALTLAQDNLRSLNGIVEINTARVRSGDLAAVELNRSQVAALQYQTAVKQAELQLRQAKNKLALLVGRGTSPEFQIAEEIRRDPQPLVLESIRSQAHERRPDLLALQRNQARNQADIRLQLAQGKIDYTIGTEYTHQQAPGGYGDSLGIYFSTPLPVFNRNQGEIARAQRAAAQAGAQIKALEARVDSEVTDAWQQYSTSRELLESMERDILSKVRDVRQITEYSYRRGEASLVEFLDAQRAFNDAMESYNEARGSYARSLYLIDSVTATVVAGNVAGN